MLPQSGIPQTISRQTLAARAVVTPVTIVTIMTQRRQVILAAAEDCDSSDTTQENSNTARTAYIHVEESYFQQGRRF